MYSWIIVVLISILNLNYYCIAYGFYPSNSAYGIFAAIAVPLDLANRNVFVSYNFEANYNLPQKWSIPPIFNGDVDLANVNNDDIDDIGVAKGKGYESYDVVNENDSMKTICLNCTISLKPVDDFKDIKRDYHNPSKRSLLSRVNFYQILIDKFQRHGLEGESCLLRLICELNSSDLSVNNGILGHFLHIMFTPTTSRDERLPQKYYQAEINGLRSQCHGYWMHCKYNLLDFISTPIYEILNRIAETI